MPDKIVDESIEEQLEKALLPISQRTMLELKVNVQNLFWEQSQRIRELEGLQSIQSAYKTDMESTISTLANIVGVRTADALIAKVTLMHEALDNALNVLIGSCVSAGGVDDAAALLEAKRQLREALSRDS